MLNPSILHYSNRTARKQDAKIYPEIDITDAFAEIASLPILTYDSIDVESNRCLGAAIWMLKQAFLYGQK